MLSAHAVSADDADNYQSRESQETNEEYLERIKWQMHGRVNKGLSIPYPRRISWICRQQDVGLIKQVGSGIVFVYRDRNIVRLRESDGGFDFVYNFTDRVYGFWGDDHSIYVVTGKEIILFEIDDQQIKWREDLYSIEHVISDGEGVFFYRRYDQIKGELFARGRLGGRLWSRKLMYDKKLRLDEKYLYVIGGADVTCMEKGSGKNVWEVGFDEWRVDRLELVRCRFCSEIVLFKSEEKLLAASRATGKKIWEMDIETGSSVESTKDFAVITTKRGVAVVRTRDGSISWKKENLNYRGGEFEVHKDKLYIQESHKKLMDKFLAVYDLESGKLEWRYQSGRVLSLIVTKDHWIFVSRSNGIMAIKKTPLAGVKRK